jgi:hypothetical protein
VSVESGRYRHYKGGEYEVYGVARHSETDERLVVYRPCYGDRELWVRPLAMFSETVRVDGEMVPRFTRVRAQLPSDSAAIHAGPAEEG